MVAAAKDPLCEHFLYPATIFGSDKPARVQTILGSCVAVCLFDKIREHGAINHYMLPHWNGHGMPSPKYGDIAIMRLIEKMMALGSVQENIVAKIFGGADQLGGHADGYQIGSRNVSIAESMLKAENIPILSRSTGGIIGRKIVFHTHNNNVLLKFLRGITL
jgi:chemotaxis protein CheD